MSSKRKSPPTKLQEGAQKQHPDIPALELTEPKELDSDEKQINPHTQNTQNYYKLSPSSSNHSLDQSEEELNNLEDETPVKRQRFSPSLEMTNNLIVPNSFLGLHSVNDLQARRRGSSECSSPGADSKLGLCNNNNSLLNHNSALSLAQPHKRTMDDVLKRLTSKMNNSTIKEEKRPTPSTTPVKMNSERRQSMMDAVSLPSLTGDSVLEKERQLSEMIMQLQMVREQLLAQQEHAKNLGNVSAASDMAAMEMRLQQEQIRRHHEQLARRSQGAHPLYPGPPLALLPLLEQMRPQQPPVSVSAAWSATAELARMTANARSPPAPTADPDTPLNLTKPRGIQRTPSPQVVQQQPPPMMLPRFMPYPPVDESTQYGMQQSKDDDFGASCNLLLATAV